MPRWHVSVIGVGNRYENRCQNKGCRRFIAFANFICQRETLIKIDSSNIRLIFAMRDVLAIQQILFLRYVFNRHIYEMLINTFNRHIYEYGNIKSNVDACDNLIWPQLIEFFNRDPVSYPISGIEWRFRTRTYTQIDSIKFNSINFFPLRSFSIAILDA